MPPAKRKARRKRIKKKVVKGLKKTKILSTGLKVAAPIIAAGVATASGNPLAGKVTGIAANVGAAKLRQKGFGRNVRGQKVKIPTQRMIRF